MNIHRTFKYQFKLPSSIPFFSLINLRHVVFEVTTHCNLNCTYCGYGPLYNMRTHHDRIHMPFDMAKTLMDYLYNMWYENKCDYDVRETFIGFYGGEPLLNFEFIKKTVQYIEKHPIKGRTFGYTMTTNALLLDKYMDFLVEKNFNIVISLDGNRYSNSYRVDNNGKESFGRVVENVKKLRNKYPVFFKKSVSFNSVLTNRSGLLEIKKFIMSEFSKNPMVSEVNDCGVLNERISDFNEIFKSIRKEEEKDDCKAYLKKNDFSKITENQLSYNIIKYLSDNSYSAYNTLMPQKERRVFPTGTCLPFDKKLFVTVKGELLPCERINQKYSIGSIKENVVNIDFEKIAKKYTDYYKRAFTLCKSCYAKPICEQCLFYIKDIDGTPSCPNYLNKEQYEKIVANHLKYISENPETYKRMMEEMF